MTTVPDVAPDAEHAPGGNDPATKKRRTRIGGTRTRSEVDLRIKELRERDKKLVAATRAKVTIGPLKLSVEIYEHLVNLGERIGARVNAVAIAMIEEGLQSYVLTDNVPPGLDVDAQVGNRPGIALDGLHPDARREEPVRSTVVRDGTGDNFVPPERPPVPHWMQTNAPVTVVQTGEEECANTEAEHGGDE
jgi:hypothetical protein